MRLSDDSGLFISWNVDLPVIGFFVFFQALYFALLKNSFSAVSCKHCRTIQYASLLLILVFVLLRVQAIHFDHTYTMHNRWQDNQLYIWPDIPEFQAFKLWLANCHSQEMSSFAYESGQQLRFLPEKTLLLCYLQKWNISPWTFWFKRQMHKDMHYILLQTFRPTEKS